MAGAALLDQINLAVSNMAAAVRFYERFGVPLIVAADGRHASASLANGMKFELDTLEFVRQWNTGRPETSGGGAVIGFSFDSRAEVDRLYTELVEAGHRAEQPPYDAFWGARYAVVEDPDGHPIGLMSPIESDRKFWPPGEPPTFH